MNEFRMPIDAAVLSRERARARKLRQTQWWKRRLAAGACHYCRRVVGGRALTMDHIVPLGRGGSSIRGNVVPACKDCNNAKKGHLPVEWHEYLARLAATSDD